MEFFSCDANLVIFLGKIEMFSASRPVDRGFCRMKKRMARVSHPLKDSIVNITIW